MGRVNPCVHTCVLRLAVGLVGGGYLLTGRVAFSFSIFALDGSSGSRSKTFRILIDPVYLGVIVADLALPV
jgi:hypothetical protein